MNSKKVENRLALAGALLVLLGVSFAANSAFADETEAKATDSAANNSERSAETANRQAADDAVDSIAADNELDLEIRLLGRTSTIVARSD